MKDLLIKSDSLITEKQNQFVPKCPHCNQPMQLVPGQKSGAWRCANDGGASGEACKNKGGEWWDKLGSEDYLRPKIKRREEPVSQDSGLPGPLSLNPISCRRCLADMFYLNDKSWVCPDCLSQYFPEGVVEGGDIAALVEKTVDQKIRCRTRDVMRPGEGFKMQMSAKKKSRGRSNSGRNRKNQKKDGTWKDARYGAIVRNNMGTGAGANDSGLKKGA